MDKTVACAKLCLVKVCFIWSLPTATDWFMSLNIVHYYNIEFIHFMFNFVSDFQFYQGDLVLH